MSSGDESEKKQELERLRSEILSEMNSRSAMEYHSDSSSSAVLANSSTSSIDSTTSSGASVSDHDKKDDGGSKQRGDGDADATLDSESGKGAISTNPPANVESRNTTRRLDFESSTTSSGSGAATAPVQQENRTSRPPSSNGSNEPPCTAEPTTAPPRGQQENRTATPEVGPKADENDTAADLPPSDVPQEGSAAAAPVRSTSASGTRPDSRTSGCTTGSTCDSDTRQLAGEVVEASVVSATIGSSVANVGDDQRPASVDETVPPSDQQPTEPSANTGQGGDDTESFSSFGSDDKDEDVAEQKGVEGRRAEATPPTEPPQRTTPKEEPLEANGAPDTTEPAMGSSDEKADNVRSEAEDEKKSLRSEVGGSSGAADTCGGPQPTAAEAPPAAAADEQRDMHSGDNVTDDSVEAHATSKTENAAGSVDLKAEDTNNQAISSAVPDDDDQTAKAEEPLKRKKSSRRKKTMKRSSSAKKKHDKPDSSPERGGESPAAFAEADMLTTDASTPLVSSMDVSPMRGGSSAGASPAKSATFADEKTREAPQHSQPLEPKRPQSGRSTSSRRPTSSRLRSASSVKPLTAVQLAQLHHGFRFPHRPRSSKIQREKAHEVAMLATDVENLTPRCASPRSKRIGPPGGRSPSPQDEPQSAAHSPTRHSKPICNLRQWSAHASGKVTTRIEHYGGSGLDGPAVTPARRVAHDAAFLWYVTRRKLNVPL